MPGTGVVGLLLGAALVVLPTEVSAAPSGETPPKCRRACTAAVTGNGDNLDVTGTVTGISQEVPGRGNPARSRPAPGRNEYERVEEELAPACLGNERGGDNLCASATLSCPSPEQTRYWIWHRVTRVVVAPPSETVGSWVQEPGSFCLGPDDPGLPTIGRVIAQVRADFQRLPLPKFTVRTDPAPRTLVNVPTAFSAGSAEPVMFTPTILGARVTITARPSQWDWTFGDGATLTTTRPGSPQRPDVTHQYTRTGEVTSSVRVTWTGSFTVEGSAEVLQIGAPAFVQGAPTLVDIREARTELVSR